MKGGYVHEIVMLERLEQMFDERGFETMRQVRTRSGRKTGYADLVVTYGSSKLLVEAEMSSKRIVNDIQKAQDLGAAWLWIVVPNPKVRRSVRKQLLNLAMNDMEPWICVLTIGQAVQRVKGCFPFFFESMVKGENKKEC